MVSATAGNIRALLEGKEPKEEERVKADALTEAAEGFLGRLGGGEEFAFCRRTQK